MKLPMRVLREADKLLNRKRRTEGIDEAPDKVLWEEGKFETKFEMKFQTGLA